MNERIIELVVGAAFLYVGYLKFSLIGLNHLLLFPILTVHMLLFFVIGGSMVLSRPSMVLGGLAVVALGISLFDTGFFNSYSLSFLFYKFQSQMSLFLKDFLLPLAAIYWAFRGGEF